MRINIRRYGGAAAALFLIGAVIVRGAPDNDESGRYTTWSAFGGSLRLGRRSFSSRTMWRRSSRRSTGSFFSATAASPTTARKRGSSVPKR